MLFHRPHPSKCSLTNILCDVKCYVCYNNNNNHFTALYLGLPSWDGTRRNTYHYDQPSFISFRHLLQSIVFCLFNLNAWQSFAQPLSRSSMVYLWVWNPLIYTSYISSPNHYLFLTTPGIWLGYHNTCPYHCNWICCSTEIMSSIPSLSLLGVPPHFISLQATSHFHAMYNFTYNCCTVSLS